MHPVSIEVNLPKQKLVIYARVYTAQTLCKLRFSKGQFADILRKKVEKKLKEGMRSDSFSIHPVNWPNYITIIWETHPMWWSDHLEWYKAPFCGEKVPPEGWMAVYGKQNVDDPWLRKTA